MMRIAIAGAGIAGSYLAALLIRDGLSPDLYDPMDHPTRCSLRSCGWGVPAGIGGFLERVGLDPAAYVLEPMSLMHFDDLTAQTPLVTIDKPRLVRDLRRGIPVIRGRIDPDGAGEYDLIVDATGIARALLPPCRSDLVLPTLQQRVAFHDGGAPPPGAGVYGDMVPGLGYVWVFPVGGGEYHIGVGGLGGFSPDEVIREFLEDLSAEHPFTPLCTCRGAIRVASPHFSTPFSARLPGKGTAQPVIIGIGEAIGTVVPFTGEGIAPSLESAAILAAAPADPPRYTRAILRRFAWMRRERETLDYLLGEGRTGGPRIRDRWRFFTNARRSGIRLPLPEAFRRMGSLTRWLDGQG